ncbi:MAG TPA: hypothetical protein VJZ32_04680 [Candidatus Bathyarchaeia archaeon]|nr:hypothetical protein [Candidatus Bathyarchaeia archaeon]
MSVSKAHERLLVSLLFVIAILGIFPSVNSLGNRKVSDVRVSGTMYTVGVLLTKTFTLTGARVENHFCSSIIFGPFIAAAGQLVMGTIVSTQPGSFYIIGDKLFSTIHASTCLQYQGEDALYATETYDGVSLRWLVPTSGNYYFFFTNDVPNDASVAAYIGLYASS